MQLKNIQQSFLDAICEPDKVESLSGFLSQEDDVNIADRVAVYRNNLFGSLRSVLEETYPLCCKLVGEEAFKVVAWNFVEKYLPQHGCLIFYGAEFPEHISSYPPLMEAAPYLRDMAQYEWNCHESYYAIEQDKLGAEDIAKLGEEQFAGYSLSLCCSTKTIHSHYPLKKIASYVKKEPDELLTYDEGNYYFIIYRDDEVLVEEIDELYYRALELLPASPEDLTTLFLNQKAETQFEQFIHYLFQKQLTITT